jgi:hypothetical protein
MNLPPLVKLAISPADNEYDLDYSECLIDEMFYTLHNFKMISENYRNMVSTISASYREIGSYYCNTASEIKWAKGRILRVIQEEK